MMVQMTPVLGDTFMIFIVVPSKESIHAFRSTVGNGSRSHTIYLEKTSLFATLPQQ